MISKPYILVMILTLCLVCCGCGGGAQKFLQQSGADYKKVEQMNWSNEGSAEDTNWTTYMDLNQ